MKRTRKYKVTVPCFGLKKKGDIIDCKVIAYDGDQGIYLVYHPPTKGHIGECGCYEFCEMSGEYLVSIDNRLYCNDT